MSDQLHKFPSTPHLLLGSQMVRGDKVLAPSSAGKFLSSRVVIEEKIDGANLGLSFNEFGKLCFQNRGNWLAGKLIGQWARLREWSSKHEPALRDNLPKQHILFGEWCYAKHSIFYEYLPDWFVGFDVYDCTKNEFWSTDRRNLLLAASGISRVPQIAHGCFTETELQAMARGGSAFGSSSREGIYLRRENSKWLVERAKIVNWGFTQAISEHWTRQRLVKNNVRDTAQGVVFF